VGEPVDGRRRVGSVHGDEQLRVIGELCDMRRLKTDLDSL